MYTTIININNGKEITVANNKAMEFANAMMKISNIECINAQIVKDCVRGKHDVPVMFVIDGNLVVSTNGKGTFVAPVILYKGKVLEWKDINFYSDSCKETNNKKKEVASQHTFYLGAEYCPRYYGGYSAIGIVADC